MQWNLENIRFLHPPFDFVGSFSNELMQKRHKAMQESKLQEIHAELENAKSPVEAMFVLHQDEHIKFVHNNYEAFNKDESLEKTVLRLYFRKNTPFAPAGVLEDWVSLLNLCDRKKLLEQGKPVSEQGLTCYRGSLTGIKQGLSWTTDIKEARWILKRWEDKSVGGGTVYSTHVHQDDILVYIVDEKRQEVLLKPEKVENVTIKTVTGID